MVLFYAGLNKIYFEIFCEIEDGELFGFNRYYFHNDIFDKNDIINPINPRISGIIQLLICLCMILVLLNIVFVVCCFVYKKKYLILKGRVEESEYNPSDDSNGESYYNDIDDSPGIN